MKFYYETSLNSMKLYKLYEILNSMKLFKLYETFFFFM